MPETRSGRCTHRWWNPQMTKSMKLYPGGKVEVRSLEEGFLGSWHPGLLISANGGCLTVIYDNIVREDNLEEPLHEDIPFPSAINGLIRPCPPMIDMREDLDYSLCVDAFYDDAWWEGVVLDDSCSSEDRIIFFPDQGDEIRIEKNRLRLTQDWNEATGNWTIRGKWVFLDIIRDYERDNMIPVSVKQLWYDVREKEMFNQLKEWNSPLKQVWEQLVVEVIKFYTKLTAKEILDTAHYSQEFVGADDETLTQDTEIEHDLGSCLMDETDAKTTALQSKGGLELVVYSGEQSEMEQLMVLSESPSDQVNYGSHRSRDTSEESCCLSTKICDGNYPTSKSKSSKQWKPAEGRIVSGPKCLPSSVSEYLHQSRTLTTVKNLRSHLLCLGWKIEYSDVEHCVRVRYISPQGKIYYSLQRVVKSLTQDQANLVNSSSVSVITCRDLSIHPCADNSLAVHDTDQASVVPVVDAEYFPQIVTEYLEYANNHPLNNRKEMAIKARKHLAAMGWSFRVAQKKNKSQQWFYYSSDSPRKAYSSIKTALESIQAKGSDTNCLPSTSPYELEGVTTRLASNDMASTTNNELQLSLVPVIKHSKEVGEDKLGNSGTLKFYTRKKGKRQALLQKCSLSHDIFSDGLMNDGKPRFTNNLRADISRGKRKERTFSYPTQAVRSSKRVRQLTSSHQNPFTILTWLIENDMVLPRQKVYCKSEERSDEFLEGKICHDGIKCLCCNKVVSVGEFQVHARSLYNWSVANVFFDGKKSLVYYQKRMLKRKLRRLSEEKFNLKRKTGTKSESDYICSVCHDGGTLVLCDHCPSSFHMECVGLMDLPEGDWFCPSCCCAFCGRSEFIEISGEVKTESCRSCHQCERKYHVSCKPGGFKSIIDVDTRKWFCSRACVKVYNSIQKILGKPIPVGPENNLTWTLIKGVPYEKVDCDDNTSLENYSKLSIALEVLHECFEPVKDSRTGQDLAEGVIFSRGSDLRRLSFKGFYTVLLEKNEAVISVATTRIFGNRVAEVPLVGTRYQYRRLGMCRVLMNQLEKTLTQLGVEKLVLPAVHSVLNTWTGSFGFSKISQSDRREFLPDIFLGFQDTIMCEKLLEENRRRQSE